MEERKNIKYIVNLEPRNEEEEFEIFLQNNQDNPEVQKIQLVKAILDILKLNKGSIH